MTKTAFAACVGAAVLIGAGAAHAGDIGPFDRNNDDALNPVEFARALTGEGVLTGLDFDNDGALSPIETADVFAYADANRNGGVTQDEYDLLLGVPVEDETDEDDEASEDDED